MLTVLTGRAVLAMREHIERSARKGIDARIAHKRLATDRISFLERELAVRIVRSQRAGDLGLLNFGCIKHTGFIFHPFSR